MSGKREKPSFKIRDPKDFEAGARATVEEWPWYRREAYPETGQVMQDGSVYAGPSPEFSHLGLFAAPAAAPLALSFNDAVRHARKMNARKYLGHNDWRLPSVAELRVLNAHKQKGGLTESFKSLYYWSSATAKGGEAAYYWNNITGRADTNAKAYKYAVCLVRWK